jgi:hypothetical protein
MTEKEAIESATAHLTKENVQFDRTRGVKPYEMRGRKVWVVFFLPLLAQRSNIVGSDSIYVTVDDETGEAAIFPTL